MGLSVNYSVLRSNEIKVLCTIVHRTRHSKIHFRTEFVNDKGGSRPSSASLLRGCCATGNGCNIAEPETRIAQ
jgi:hypothetical protein